MTTERRHRWPTLAVLSGPSNMGTSKPGRVRPPGAPKFAGVHLSADNCRANPSLHRSRSPVSLQARCVFSRDFWPSLAKTRSPLARPPRTQCRPRTRLQIATNVAICQRLPAFAEATAGEIAVAGRRSFSEGGRALTPECREASRL